MEPLVVFPDPPSALARALADAETTFVVVDSLEAEQQARPDAGWRAALVVARSTPGEAAAFAAALGAETPEVPIMVLVDAECLETAPGELADAEADFDDFCVLPLRSGELELRLARLASAAPGTDETDADVIEYGPLRINTTTYQAMIDGEPLDLTYMEYELLKYFAQRPGRVCTREVLLGQVWGYEYYGGARTVDVHVRRLRAKLGEHHAGLIGTVRSVGYRFGTSPWG